MVNASGWSFIDEGGPGKRKWGYIATKPDSLLSIKVRCILVCSAISSINCVLLWSLQLGCRARRMQDEQTYNVVPWSSLHVRNPQQLDLLVLYVPDRLLKASYV